MMDGQIPLTLRFWELHYSTVNPNRMGCCWAASPSRPRHDHSRRAGRRGCTPPTIGSDPTNVTVFAAGNFNVGAAATATVAVQQARAFPAHRLQLRRRHTRRGALSPPSFRRQLLIHKRRGDADGGSGGAATFTTFSKTEGGSFALKLTGTTNARIKSSRTRT
jgi:hypothetical protein